MSKTINILIAIDTDRVKTIPNPSKDSNNPTGIGHDYGYMVASGTTVNSGQGTGDLNINALVGDTVRAFATSGSDNFEDAVLLYGMPRFAGDTVMSPYSYISFTKSTVVAQSAATPLPARFVDETFWFFQANVIIKGTEQYMVQFAVYVRDATTGQPVLYGYFAWDPTIRVQG
jgi:nematocidal protein AidA